MGPAAQRVSVPLYPEEELSTYTRRVNTATKVHFLPRRGTKKLMFS